MRDYTEEEYHDHLVATLDEADDAVMDHVASLTEWGRLKSALARWVAETEDKMDAFARQSEHEDDS